MYFTDPKLQTFFRKLKKKIISPNIEIPCTLRKSHIGIDKRGLYFWNYLHFYVNKLNVLSEFINDYHNVFPISSLVHMLLFLWFIECGNLFSLATYYCWCSCAAYERRSCYQRQKHQQKLYYVIIIMFLITFLKWLRVHCKMFSNIFMEFSYKDII